MYSASTTPAIKIFTFLPVTTYACRVFDSTLAAHFDSRLNHGTLLKDKHFRCRNNNDIVPCMMPPPYCHVGTEIYIDRL